MTSREFDIVSAMVRAAWRRDEALLALLIAQLGNLQHAKSAKD